MNHFLDVVEDSTAFFDRAETKVDAEVAHLKAKITELESALSTVKTDLAAREAEVVDLKAELEPQAVRITTLEAKLKELEEKCAAEGLESLAP